MTHHTDQLSASCVSISHSLVDAWKQGHDFDPVSLSGMEEAATRVLFLCSVLAGERKSTVVRIADHLAAVPRHGSVTVTQAHEIGEAG